MTSPLAPMMSSPTGATLNVFSTSSNTGSSSARSMPHASSTKSGVRKQVPELISVDPPTPRPIGSEMVGTPIEMLALFEDDDLQARLRQLHGGHRAAGAAADDNHVCGVVEALVRLHDLELDYARVALDLFVGLGVISDERLDAVVRAEEHENQRLERDERFAALADLRFLAVHEIGLARSRSQHPKRPRVTAGDGR